MGQKGSVNFDSARAREADVVYFSVFAEPIQ